MIVFYILAPIAALTICYLGVIQIVQLIREWLRFESARMDHLVSQISTQNLQFFRYIENSKVLGEGTDESKRAWVARNRDPVIPLNESVEEPAEAVQSRDRAGGVFQVGPEPLE